MSKRLQILLEESELESIREAAGREGVTVSDWARRALRSAQSQVPRGDQARKLAVVRAAARNEFPAAEIDQMLAEIERGYLK